VAQPLPEPPQLALDLRRRLAVALRSPGKPLEAHRLAPGDRRRREVAELPLERAVDRAAEERYVLLQSDHRRARLHRSRLARALPRPLREHAEHSPLAHHLAHAAD